MSIEVVFYPKQASRQDLKRHLVALGFKPSGHLWQWPKGSLHFFWFDAADYKSFNGVEATIYPKRAEEQQEYPGSEWALHTRTRALASPEDHRRQNFVIRKARKQFQGTFINDWYGKNRYIPTEEDRRDPVARGIFLLYESVTSSISAVKVSVPNPTEGFQKFIGTDLEALSTADPARVLYNALIPFVVAALEHFFSQTFRMLLRYDANAQRRLKEETRKLEIADALSIRDGERTIEDVVAQWYSFQSVDSIHKAFKQWFDIDFWSLIRRKKKIRQRILRLDREFVQLIESRHGVVHAFEMDLNLGKEKIEELLDLAVALIDIFVSYLETQRGTPIRDR